MCDYPWSREYDARICASPRDPRTLYTCAIYLSKRDLRGTQSIAGLLGARASILPTHSQSAHSMCMMKTRCASCLDVQARLHQDPKASLRAIQQAIQWEKGAGFVNCVGEKCAFADYLVCCITRCISPPHAVSVKPMLY